MEIEIYAGDDFFQLQPDGLENGVARVKQGTTVCWYNVGTQPHSVTGGPWRDSGDLGRAQSFIWVADRIGVYPYRCRYHTPHMTATLEVVA
ncbi:MAG: cupredoxin domain-containing protein, partial [Gemmatimonadaceae bacterium]